MLSRKIVFSRSEANGKHKDVFVLEPNGALTRVTFGLSASPVYDSAGPDWSGDGTWLVFDSTRDASDPQRVESDLYKLELAAPANVQRLTTAAYSESPSWSSAEHGKIAFMSNRGDADSQYDVYVMEGDGSNQTRLVQNANDEMSPRWSPDGTKIVFARAAAGPEKNIVVADYPGGTETVVTSGHRDDAPSFSPDGSKIVFSRMQLPFVHATRELYTINADGTGETQLTFSGIGVTNENPCWSPAPAADKIVFDSDRNWNNRQIYEMDADGSGIVAVTADSYFDHHRPVYAPL